MSAGFSCVEAGHSGTLNVFLVDVDNRLDHDPRLSLVIQKLRYEVARPSKATDHGGRYHGERLCSFAVDNMAFGPGKGLVKPKKQMNAAVSAHGLMV